MMIVRYIQNKTKQHTHIFELVLVHYQSRNSRAFTQGVRAEGTVDVCSMNIFVR